MTKEQFSLFLAKQTHSIWQKEEDSCIKQECGCGWCEEYEVGEYHEEPYSECPECECLSLVNYTLHEETSCNKCGCNIGMWEDCYERKIGRESFRICNDCFDSLEDENDVGVELNKVWEK